MKYADYLKVLKDCPFCGLSKKRIVENATAFLTYSIAPYHEDHLLVVPKRHVEHILDLNEKETGDLGSLQKQGLEILIKLGHTNMSVLVKEGDKVEKSISHTHYHLIPDIVLSNSDHTGLDRETMTEDEVDDLLSRIDSVL